MAFMAAISTVALLPGLARAEKRNAPVMVSVQVVESCRVETNNVISGTSVDVKMRCSSSARPNVGYASSSHALAPVGTVSVPHSQLATTENGPMLKIDF
jgi:hypothetical protein